MEKSKERSHSGSAAHPVSVDWMQTHYVILHINGIYGNSEQDVNTAVTKARAAAGKDGFILIAGSNFLIADLKNVGTKG